jgi:hypothetical protein
LQQFREKHANWIALEHDDDDVAYCLHPEYVDASLQLFDLDANSREAEKDLATTCDRNSAIAVCGDRFIKYSLLRPLLTWPSNLDLSDFLAQGWDQTHIASIKNFSNPTEKINHRLRAAAGRLVSMPAFLSARDRVHQVWQQLPPRVRPLLPIARSARIAAAHKLDLEPAPAPLAAFIEEFDRFCDEWHLLGMSTWTLPDVRGPNWVPGLAPGDSLRRGELTVSTPWHFPVLAEDGLGPILEAEHRHQAAERGVNDAASWESYAHLLGIYYWESVLCSRYSASQRKARFMTELEFLVGEILGLQVSRIRRLRTWLRGLQAGKRRSLLGCR